MTESIRNVSQKVAYKMMQFYPGNQTNGIPGLFGDPYYWWEAGAAFGVCLSIFEVRSLRSFTTDIFV